MLKYRIYKYIWGGLIIIKKGIILILTLLMVAFGIGQAIAQPMVFGPQEIIDKSELIVVGTITKNLASANERTVTLKVDGVLKGNVNSKEITLSMKKPADGNWLDFNFPGQGQQVFLPLIMTTATNYGFYSDLFSVGLVKDGKVTLFNPNNINSDDQKNYESVYTDYVKNNYKGAPIKEEEKAPAAAPVVNSNEVKTVSATEQKVEEKKVSEDNQVFKAQEIVKKKDTGKSHYRPRVRESITMAIWLVIIFYSLSLVNIGRKDV